MVIASVYYWGVGSGKGKREESSRVVQEPNVPIYDEKPGKDIGDVCINPKDGAEMVWVPAGEFDMGTGQSEIEAFLKEHLDWKAKWFDDEKPRHKVYLDGYWIYKHEVTVAQYRKFCKETGREMPREPKWGWHNSHPIVNVSWEDASAYAKWAGCRLPTEAEWEKAARGIDGRLYPWGNEWPPSKRVGNFADESLKRESPHQNVIEGYDDGNAYTSPVGSFPAGVSPYGCLDMAGNVWEWCSDWYDSEYYNNMPMKNPKGPNKREDVMTGTINTGPFRVLRGGSWWNCYPELLRTANRNWCLPELRDSNFGFLCVCSR